jgi:hypothetical protein
MLLLYFSQLVASINLRSGIGTRRRVANRFISFPRHPVPSNEHFDGSHCDL